VEFTRAIRRVTALRAVYVLARLNVCTDYRLVALPPVSLITEAAAEAHVIAHFKTDADEEADDQKLGSASAVVDIAKACFISDLSPYANAQRDSDGYASAAPMSLLKLHARVVLITRASFEWKCACGRVLEAGGSCTNACIMSQSAIRAADSTALPMGNAIDVALAAGSKRKREIGDDHGVTASTSSTNLTFVCEASCVIDDGSGEAQLYVNGDHVWKLLRFPAR